MAIRDLLKVSRKTFFDPRAWLGYDEVKDHTSTVWNNLKAQCVVSAPTREETFTDAMARLGLTEEDIQNSIKSYRLFALIFFIFGILAFAYAFYLLFQHYSITGWMLGLVVCALFMSQAFRFDFWSFQMKKRQLGLTFAEWKNHILGKKEMT
jgi:intracellular multiplication protein IcmV